MGWLAQQAGHLSSSSTLTQGSSPQNVYLCLCVRTTLSLSPTSCLPLLILFFGLRGRWGKISTRVNGPKQYYQHTTATYYILASFCFMGRSVGVVLIMVALAAPECLVQCGGYCKRWERASHLLLLKESDSLRTETGVKTADMSPTVSFALGLWTLKQHAKLVAPQPSVTQRHWGMTGWQDRWGKEAKWGRKRITRGVENTVICSHIRSRWQRYF